MKLSRRELGMAALAGTMMAQAQEGTAEAPLEDQALDPVYWTRMRHDAAPLRMAFHADNKKQAEAWQKRLRGKVTELLGGFPSSKTPLNARIVSVKEFPNYRRERFVFTSRPGVMVAGYVLTPKKSSGPHAAMVCVPGHGRGVDDIVGIDEKGREREDKAGYQHDFAIQAVEHGMAAVAIEPMAFGCRRDARTKGKGAGTSACQPAAGAALLFGETMIGWRVYDVMRTIDFIETRKDLDSARVGCMGISGGGTVTLFSSALDPRIKAAMVSGYLNTFKDCILSLSHCIDNYVPGILQWAEMYDVAGLIAPRPLFAESGTRDPIFPIAASKESFARVKKIYGVFEADGSVEHEVFEGEHLFHGVKGLPFLAQQLKVG
ncbi:MAG: alpha/beta hydrolase family protein [Bryobacteraceae bacterium]